MEDSLMIGYDNGGKEDITMMVVMRNSGDSVSLICARMNDDAEKLYRILTDQSCRFKIETFD